MEVQENDSEQMNPLLYSRSQTLSEQPKPSSVSQVSIDKFKEDLRQRKMNTGGTSRRIIDRLQGIYLSKKISSYVPVSTEDSSDPNSSLHFSGRVPLIRGIDRVINGTKPAADVVLICGIKPLRYLWYMLSGVCCDSIQFGIDICLYHFLHITDPSICWVLGFGLSIIFRHSFHRYLVFGAYVGGYWKSLFRMYTGYSVTIFLSTVFNIVMTKNFHVSHYKAWVATLLWTGIVNYFILKHIWNFGGDSSSVGNRGSIDSRNEMRSSSNSRGGEIV